MRELSFNEAVDMTLYMKVTRDKYELPIAVAETINELAKMLGTTPESVSSSISHKRQGWHKLEVEDGEEIYNTRRSN